MTFTALLAALEPLDSTASLVFLIDDDEIGAGYHVTELRHSISTGIDCGGNVEAWDEAHLQLLDGAGKTHMSVSKFTTILRQSLNKLPQLSEAPLLAEFSLDNDGLKLMSMGAPIQNADRVTVRLRNTNAVCKPARRHKSLDAKSSACCTGSNSKGGCCGSAPATDASERCCA